MGLFDKIKIIKTSQNFTNINENLKIADETVNSILSKFKDKDKFYSSLKKANRDIVCYAISHEDEETAIKLLELIENIDKEDYQGFTYLTTACLEHKTNVIRELLIKGANPNHKSNPILKALGRKNINNPEILKLFIEYGLNLDLQLTNNDLNIRETILSFEDQKLNEIINKFENR